MADGMTKMNPFEVLGVEARFDVDLRVVERNHRELSKALHPDRYVGAGASERKAALGKAVEVNEAWRVVRDPVRRAEALFARAGVATGETNEPKPSGELLMDVMELREALADAKAARDTARVQALAADVEKRAAAVEQKLARALAAGGDASRHLATLGELRFYRRFLDEVSVIEDLLAEAS